MHTTLMRIRQVTLVPRLSSWNQMCDVRISQVARGYVSEREVMQRKLRCLNFQSRCH